MNAKKAKDIRRLLKSRGIDPTQAVYYTRNVHMVHGTVVDKQGKVIKNEQVAVKAHTRVLVNGCGRAIYLQLKKVTV